jgi:hypothetical protein
MPPSGLGALSWWWWRRRNLALASAPKSTRSGPYLGENAGFGRGRMHVQAATNPSAKVEWIMEGLPAACSFGWWLMAGAGLF